MKARNSTFVAIPSLLRSVRVEPGILWTHPFGEWRTGTNGETYWVVEEFPSETMILVR